MEARLMTSPPSDTSRRRFLGGVVGGAVVGAVGVSGATVLGVSTPNARGGGLIRYRGMRRRGGPAPRALPQVPIGIDDNGYLYGKWPKTTKDGVPATELGGVRYSADWFRYCAFTDYAGFDSAVEVDSYLRAAPETPYGWQTRDVAAGDRLHVEEFADYETWGNDIGEAGIGKPALATWRGPQARRTGETATAGQRTALSFSVQVFRSTEVEQLRADGGEWLRASTTPEGFIACAAACTYNCAITGFKAIEESERFSAGDEIYCPDCQSTFRPFDIVQEEFVAPSKAEPKR